jgi:hypothetical protein
MDNMLAIQPVNNKTSEINQHVFEGVRTGTEDNQISTAKPFIQANTIEATLEEIRKEHILPVFIKDNEPLISQVDFIDATISAVGDMFPGELILKPSIRLSHPIKGRIPDAKEKPAALLKDWERTIYYERMAFIIEIPSITDIVGGNQLSLTIGGIKAYNLDNLGSRKGSDEHFKIFIGFENKVCTNLCVWSDGTMIDLKVSSMNQLIACIRTLIQNYNHNFHLSHLKQLCNHHLTEQQFAMLIGRCRMYNHLPSQLKREVAPILFGDSQIGMVCKDYYRDNSFCKDDDGNINLWKLFNLFTNTNKSTYIDSFVERGSNAFSFVYNLKQALQHQTFNWYLS